jgi:hypothetical protein
MEERILVVRSQRIASEVRRLKSVWRYMAGRDHDKAREEMELKRERRMEDVSAGITSI